jgi:hypothetical protein
MKFQERWDAMWMAITFEEAGEHEMAASIYQESQRQEKDGGAPAPGAAVTPAPLSRWAGRCGPGMVEAIKV